MPTRHASLRISLDLHRQELTNDVQARIRKRRESGVVPTGDIVEDSDAALEEGLQLALLEMRAQALIHVDQAIARLDAGAYGTCRDCDEDIAEARLHALPFAVRCRECQKKHERRAVRQLSPLGAMSIRASQG